MTTARDHATTRSPFEQGAGFVAPNKAVDPGLVFDSGWADWLAFLEGQGAGIGVEPIDASDMNVASLAIGDLAGTQTVTRTVTNVGGAETYTASTTGLPGLKVTVSPSTFTIPKGGTQKLTITVKRTSAPVDEYSTGFLRLKSPKHTVRVPVAVQPVAVAVPAEISGSGVSGSAQAKVVAGYSGTLKARVVGLSGATPQAGTVKAGDIDLANPQPGPAVVKYTVNVPAGTTLARFDVDATNDGADLDLFVFKGGSLVGVSASGAADEQVSLLGPAAGAYEVYVNGFGMAAGESTAAFEFTPYVVGSTNLGNVSVSPASTSVSIGAAASFTVAWSGLDPAKRYLGWIGWNDGSADLGVTVVSVN